MNMQSPNTFHVENSFKNIFSLAVPMVIAILIPQINFLTNTFFLGNYSPSNRMISTQEILSATGIASIFYLTLAMVGYGMSSGVLMLLSRAAGKDNSQRLSAVFANSWAVTLILSVFLLVMSWLVSPILFHNTLKNEVVQEAAISFQKWRIIGLPFLMVSQLINSFFLATSHSNKIIIGSIAQTISNIILDYFLILGNGGFPELGIEGSAIASFLSEIIYCGVSLVVFYFLIQKMKLKFSLKNTIDKRLMKNIFAKSSPLLLQYLLSVGAWEVFFIFVEHLGKTESAASQLLRSVFGVVGIAAFALGAVANSMVSNLIGQNRENEVWSLLKKISTISLLFSCFMGTFLFLFPKIFLGILTYDQEMIDASKVALRVVVLSSCVLSVGTVLFNAVLGTGLTRISLLIEFVGIAVYLFYSFVIIEILRMGLSWAWGAEFVYWTSLLLMSAWFLRSGKWKKR